LPPNTAGNADAARLRRTAEPDLNSIIAYITRDNSAAAEKVYRANGAPITAVLHTSRYLMRALITRL
jgi:hypothetical protein